MTEEVADDKLVKNKTLWVVASVGRLIEQNETQVRREIKSQLLDKSQLVINSGRLSYFY